MSQDKQRSALTLGAVVAAVALIAAVAGYLAFRSPPADVLLVDAGVEDAGPTETPLVVAAVEGEAQRRGADSEEWQPLQEGDLVRSLESLQTLGSGRVTLRGQDQSELTLLASALATLEAAGPEGTELTLGRGLLDATLPEGARRLRVRAAGDTYAEARRGKLRMMRGAGTTLTVAVYEGDATLFSAGVEQAVVAGSFASAAEGQAPAAARPIPPSLLQAKGSGARLVRRDREEIRGKVTPGALIFVGGELVQVDAEGNFKRAVPLQEGTNKIRVVMYGLDGKELSWGARPIKRDTRAPKPQFGKPTFGD